MTQSDFIRDLAEYTHFTLGDLMNRGNALREEGMLARGGRGLSARSIELDEATLIILAAMSGASANTCPDAVRKHAAWENVRAIDLSAFPPDEMIRREVDGAEIESIAVKDYDPEGVDMTQVIDLGGAVTEILADPAGKADFVKSFTVDHVNNFAVITWTDGREQVFGKKDDFNSGATTVLSGRVLGLLGFAIAPRRKGSAAARPRPWSRAGGFF